jgi:signal transduction histidine kinase/DNA-binding response OmpR family regulator/ligand-binding sensor domain-containing protein
MSVRFIGLILLLSMLTTGHAQGGHKALYFKRLPNETQGLGDYIGFDNMCQDQDGLIWFLSGSGLLRYDGAGVRLMQSNPADLNSLSSNQIKDMLQDEAGTFWITTRKGGLNAYNPQTNTYTHYRHDAKDSTTLSTDDLLFLERDEAGKLWIGSTAGMNIFDPSTKKVIRMWPQPGQRGKLQGAPISSLAIKDEKVYALTTAGFEYYDQKSKRWQYFPLLNTTADTLRAGINTTYATFKNLCLGHEGQLWMGMPGQDGLWTFNPENQQLKRFDEWISAGKQFVRPHDIIEDRFGRLWIASGDCIWRLSADRKQYKKYVALDIEKGDTIRRIHTLFEDRDGLIWMPSNDQSWVYTFDPAQEQGQIAIIPNVGNSPLSTNQIIIGEEGLFWLLTNWGLLRFDPLSGIMDDVMLMESCHFATAIDDRYLMICSSKGLFVFDRISVKYWPVQLGDKSDRPFPATTYAAVDHDGDIWVSTWGDGLYRLPRGAFDIQRGIVKEYEQWSYQPSNPNSLPSNLLAGIVVDANNIVWVAGAENGLNAINKTTKQVQRFLYEQGVEHGISSNYTWGLLIDKEGYIWISRGNNVLERFNPESHQFETFSLADGLPNYDISTMTIDSTGTIWLNQNQAVSSFDPQTRAVHIFPQVTVPKPYNEAIAVHPKTGEIFFASHKELRSIAPDTLSNTIHNPSPLLLSGIACLSTEGGSTMTPLPEQQWKGKSLSLSYRENNIEISYALLDYRHPKLIQYQYALTPIRQAPNWIATGRKNTVSFANLAPGRYLFSVKGRNGYGVWTDEPVTLPIIIHPPWWATWWAYATYALIGMSTLLWLRRYDLRRKLAAAETQRLRELDDFKNEFFTNITHEFRTPLTVILGTSDQIKAKVDRLLQEKLDRIRRNGDLLLRLINQILDLSKLESNTLRINYVQADVLPFIRYIAESLQSLAENQGVELRTEMDTYGVVMDYDPERLLQIVYNLLANAIKFTPAGGQVRMQAAMVSNRQEKQLKLTVSDTGIGLSDSDLPHIFDRYYQAQHPQKNTTGGTGIGLALTKKLVETLGGSIQVESELGSGTTFILMLPITQQAATATDSIVQNPARSQKLPSLKRYTTTAANQVLIIEDNRDLTEYLRDCLSPYYQLDFAPNGKIGIEKALDTIPDLIISDVMMPEKDGFEVCGILKKDVRTSHIPIVLLTAKAEVEHRIAGLQRGADAYLAKPFHEAELRATLNNLIQLRRKLQQKFQQEKAKTNKQSSSSIATSSVTDAVEKAFLEAVRNIIQKHLDDTTFTVEVLSQQLSMSPRQLHRKLTALTDQAPSALIREVRLAKAKSLLESSPMNVSEVAYTTGFDDPKYFSRVFKKAYGMPPSKVGKR